MTLTEHTLLCSASTTASMTPQSKIAARKAEALALQKSGDKEKALEAMRDARSMEHALMVSGMEVQRDFQDSAL